MITTKSKIYVAGHNGMVGSAICRGLINKGYKNQIFKNIADLDLRNQNEVHSFLKYEQPDVIINAAAKVGGILANDTYPYEFIMDNMLIQNNLISSAHMLDIKKFIFLGSSCIYPKFSKQPIKEEYLLTDILEPTNEWYAIAKISGVKVIEALRKQYNRDYISLMPTNLYGINDNFNLETSHVLPALIRKFYEAKVNKNNNVLLWGSGTPKREFLYVDDLANAVIFSIENNLNESLYNVGYGTDISIKDVAILIKNIVGYEGDIEWDKSKPDGTPRKLMDSSKLNSLGWKPINSLDEGIKKTYEWYLSNVEKIN